MYKFGKKAPAGIRSLDYFELHPYDIRSDKKLGQKEFRYKWGKVYTQYYLYDPSSPNFAFSFSFGVGDLATNFYVKLCLFKRAYMVSISF